MGKKNKAQIFSLDFIISIGIFIFIITTTFLIWNNINTQIYESEKNNVFYSNLASVSSILVETPGDPSNWEELDPSELNKINQIGLAFSPNELSMKKVLALVELSPYYYNLKDRMGARSRIFIEFLDTNQNLLKVDGKELKFGLPPENAESIYLISRFVIIDHEGKQIPAYVKVVMW